MNATETANGLKVARLSNVIITKSLVIKKAVGIDGVSLFKSIDRKTRLKWELLATASIFKNRLRIWRDDNYYFIFNIWARGYYHWLIEVAVKFALFEKQLKAATVILPEDCPRFIKDFLAVIGVERYREMKGSCFLQKVNVIGSQESGHPLPEHIQLLRQFILERVPGAPVAGNKIYVSRNLARKRKVVNEEEVMRYLESQGFQCVYLENMKWVEQVNLFRNCTHLVSLHGAGLTNLILMPEGSRVTEIFPKESTSVNPCFKALSDMVGVNHEFYFASREENGQPPDFHSDNVLVDPKAFIV